MGKASSLTIICHKEPADVLHPRGLPDHVTTLIQAGGKLRDQCPKCIGADFQWVQLSTACWLQQHCTDLYQLKTCSLLLSELMYFPFVGQGQSSLMAIIVMQEVEVNLCFRMSINAKACICTFQKQREITQ